MFECDICKEKFNSMQAIGGHKSTHLKYKKKILNKNKVDKQHKCRFCQKEFINGFSLGSHVRMCKLNPSYNHRILAVKLALTGGKMSDTGRNNLRIAMRKAVDEGRHKVVKPGGITKLHEFKQKTGENITLHGSWELGFAKFLDDKNFKWNRNTKRFKYVFNDRQHSYIPDFYLHDYDLYVEVKGYETDKDKAKWIQFKHKLEIVRYKEIYNLEEWARSLTVKHSAYT